MSAITTPMTPHRADAACLLNYQVNEGQRFLAVAVGDRMSLARVATEKAAWSLRNRQVLFRVCREASGKIGYQGMKPLSSRASLPLQIEHFRQEVRSQLECLTKVLEAVE